MPLVNVRLIEGVFTPEQKTEMIHQLTETMVRIEGENLRPATWVIVEEVKSGDWGIGGKGLTAADVLERLRGLSQIELAKVDAYERKNQNRSTVLARTSTLRGEEPWPGYDELNASELNAVLGEGDEDRAKRVHAYERSHKNRAAVIHTTERETSNA